MGVAGPAGTAFTNGSTFVYLAIPPLVHLILLYSIFLLLYHEQVALNPSTIRWRIVLEGYEHLQQPVIHPVPIS